jgi:hypothetical protein
MQFVLIDAKVLGWLAVFSEKSTVISEFQARESFFKI